MSEHRDLSQRIANLSIEQRAELERRLLDSLPQDRAQIRIPRRGAGAAWPASFAQERLWVLHQLEPELVAYNLPRAVLLRGALDVTSLHRALNELVTRHESLRTTFSTAGGELVQVVGPPRAVELPIVDLGGLAPAERAADVDRLLREEARRPFDLASDLMLRGHLIRLGPAEHVLSLTMHHIASDGWSTGIVDRELVALYGAFKAGQPSPLKALPIQYADYAVWHRQWFESVAKEQLAYWRNRLAGAPPALELPADGRRLPTARSRGARQTEHIPAPLVAQLASLGRSLRATPFMVLLAVFKALLARWSGQRDVVVGTAIAGRMRVETEHLIGFFVNMLVLRTDLSGDPTVREIVERVRATALGAYGNDGMPFERLVHELKPERAVDRSPVFQVAFVLQEGGRPGLELPGLETTVLETSSDAAPFDISVSLTPMPDGMSVRATYRTDLFEATTIRRLLAHYVALLEGAVADPGGRLSTLSLTSRAQREHEERTVAEWNDTARPYQGDTGLAALYEAQAARTPDAVALVSAQERLTYAELDRRANRFARWLVKHGVRRGDLVGICLDRSADMVVAVLAVVKAGAGYVPIDPSNPPERHEYMLADAGVKALVSGANLTGQPPIGVPAVRLDADWAFLSDESDAPVGAEASGDDLAYVMYTSGSTGLPKGVAVPQRAVARLVMNADYVSLGPDDVVAHASNVAFDAATFEIWGALLNGARLVVFSKDLMLSPPDLSQALQTHGVTALFLTTALFNQTARDMPTALRSVRHVLFGGEAVEPGWVERVLAQGPPERLLHVYGPTETTTFATSYEVQAVASSAQTIPIGRPIANTHVRVLDPDLRPVPIGMPGELFIGGPGLAWGYHRRPDLTAERFVPDPSGAVPGARLYRTGDVGRYRADGVLEFLGRTDHQIKIRGYRIEPGEIEDALKRRVEAVAEAVVAVRPDGAGPRLVAWLLPAGPERPDAGVLRGALRTSLPDYMVPASFEWVESWPLTASGKVDRRALAARKIRPAGPPDGAAAMPDDERNRPRTPLEVALVEIWEDLLGVGPIGVHDNFFERGGHSLLAVRMLRAVEARLGRRVPVATLFAHATIREIAAVILDEAADLYRAPVVRIQAGSRPPFFFLHGDLHGGGFYCRELARRLGPEQTFYALNPHGVDGQPMPATIERMAQDHLREVRRLQPAGPYFLGGFCIAGLIAYEMARQLRASGETVALLAVLDSSARNTRRRRVWMATQRGARTALALGRSAFRGAHRLLRTEPRAWAPLARTMLTDRWKAEQARRHPTEFGPGSDAIDDAYVGAMRRYVPRRYDGPVSVFLAAEARSAAGPDFGWGAIARDVRVHVIPGTHLTFITRHVASLSEQMLGCLRAAQGE